MAPTSPSPYATHHTLLPEGLVISSLGCRRYSLSISGPAKERRSLVHLCRLVPGRLGQARRGLCLRSTIISMVTLLKHPSHYGSNPVSVYERFCPWGLHKENASLL